MVTGLHFDVCHTLQEISLRFYIFKELTVARVLNLTGGFFLYVCYKDMLLSLCICCCVYLHVSSQICTIYLRSDRRRLQLPTQSHWET